MSELRTGMPERTSHPPRRPVEPPPKGEEQPKEKPKKG